MAVQYELYMKNALERIAKVFFKEKFESNDANTQKQAVDGAFEVYSIAVLLDKNFDEVYKNIIIHGGQDGGIDGFYIERGTDSLTIHIFQCKNTPKIGQNMIEKFYDNFNTIFVKGNMNKANAENLTSRLKAQKFSQLSTEMILDFKLYFIFNGEKNDDRAKAALYQTQSLDIQVFDRPAIIQRMQNLLAKDTRENDVSFVFHPENSNLMLGKEDTQGLITAAVGDVKSAFFRMKALELCELLEAENTLNGSIEKLFSLNIRGFLGKQNIINDSMMETLHSKNRYFFPFLNNGITMICEQLKIPNGTQLGNYLVKVKNPTIVNGLQTTSVLYTIYKENPEQLEDIFIMMRLYETSDEELIDLLIDATNTQTAINFGDKLSNRPFVKNIKEAFAKYGIALISKRGETFKNFTTEDIRPSVTLNEILVNWYRTVRYSEAQGLRAEQILERVFKVQNSPKNPFNTLFYNNIDALCSQLLFTYCIINIAQKNILKCYRDKDSYFYHGYNSGPYLFYSEGISETNHFLRNEDYNYSAIETLFNKPNWNREPDEVLHYWDKDEFIEEHPIDKTISPEKLLNLIVPIDLDLIEAALKN